MSMLKVPVTADDHIRGNINAPISLVEYGDYECPFCGLVHPVVNRIRKHFGKNLSFVFRHFPLTEMHPHAEMAAETAEFAGAHKKFWEIHDLIYENQQRLSIDMLIELTMTLNLSVSELRSALENKIYQAKIRNDFLGGVRSGVNGTPTFFINGVRYNGSHDYDNLVMAIEEMAD